MKLRYSVQ